MEVDRMGIRGELSGALNSPGSFDSPHPIWLSNPAPLNMPSPVSKPRTLYDKIWDDHVMYVTF